MLSEDRIQILCYGDSNTWGCIGRKIKEDTPSKRFPEETRWPCVLQKNLGSDYHVIAEGLGGRTTIYSVVGEEWKNGKPYLLPCLKTHAPLDLVIIMLGTNDLQRSPDISFYRLGNGITQLIEVIQSTPDCGRNCIPPKILVIAPIEVRRPMDDGRIDLYERFHKELGTELSQKFKEVYQDICIKKGCHFLDASKYAIPCKEDGIHFTPESHINLGNAVAEYITQHIF